MSTPLNSRLLKRFLVQAGSDLEGSWLLLGGTLLPAVGLDVRATVDIDLVGLGPKENAQGLELMRLAENLGLPAEAVNSAAAFFLREAGYAETDLILLHKGRKARIFRPSLRLYWKMKASRISETDLLDCRHYWNYCLGQKDDVDFGAVEDDLRGILRRTRTEEKRRRLHSLLELLSTNS